MSMFVSSEVVEVGDLEVAGGGGGVRGQGHQTWDIVEPGHSVPAPGAESGVVSQTVVVIMGQSPDLANISQIFLSNCSSDGSQLTDDLTHIGLNLDSRFTVPIFMILTFIITSAYRLFWTVVTELR